MYVKPFEDRTDQDYYFSIVTSEQDHSITLNNMHQFRRDAFNQRSNQKFKNYSSSDKTSTEFYNNLTNNHVHSYLNNLNLDYQQYSLFNQNSFNQATLNHSSSSSSSLSSTNSSLNCKKLIVHENLKLNSNLANFVSDSQVTTSKNLAFEQLNCSLVWSNVNYKVKVNEFNLNFKNPFNLIKENEKLILNNVSGYLESGELVALIGPSGVGKSSLLEILAGRRVKGTSGKVNIDLQHLKFKGFVDKNEFKNQESKIAFIPQKDCHLGWLTVYETLIYASKIKNCKLAKKIIDKQLKLKSNLELYLNSSTMTTKANKKLGQNLSKNEQFNQSKLKSEQEFSLNNVETEDEYHKKIVHNILKDLALEACMNNLVNNCSGGQLRRLSIALELLNQPRLILIDEPTTGLDFSSALKCIQTLRCLTMMNKPPGIIASIHQPSSLVLNQFHRVYALARGGQCIYEGTVDNLVDYFSSFHINCPLYFNPADFSIQIANGDFGLCLIKKLADHQIKLHETRCDNEIKDANFKVQFNDQLNNHLNENSLGFTLPTYQVSHLKVNVKHLMKRLNRKTHPTLAHTKLLLQRSWRCTIREPTLTWLRLFQFIFTAFLIANLHNYNVGEINGCFDDLTINSTKLDQNSLIANGKDYVQQLAKIKDNSILLFFSLMFWVMSSIIPTLLTFPNEMVVMIKERSNGWYSCFSYYMAKMLCDLPFVIICPFLFCIVFYPMTGQIMLWWRFTLFYLISLLLCLIAQSLGFLVGSIFIKDKFSTIFIGSVQSFPLFMAGGYLIRESVMNWVIKPLWYISYIRYSFSAIIISIYGFGRCSNNLNNSDKSTSIQNVLSNFTRSDKTLLSQVREIVNEDDFACLYDTYYTESGVNLDNYFKNCNLSLANLFSRTMNQNTIDLNRQLEEETKLYDGSFVLSYYEIRNEHFNWSIICLILTLIFLRTINYLIILHNVKKHSKF